MCWPGVCTREGWMGRRMRSGAEEMGDGWMDNDKEEDEKPEMQGGDQHPADRGERARCLSGRRCRRWLKGTVRRLGERPQRI